MFYGPLYARCSFAHSLHCFPLIWKNIMLVKHISVKPVLWSNSRKKNPLKLMKGRNLKNFSAYLSRRKLLWRVFLVVYPSRFLQVRNFPHCLHGWKGMFNKWTINWARTAVHIHRAVALIALENLIEQTHANYKMHLLPLEKHLDYWYWLVGALCLSNIHSHSNMCPTRCSLIDYYESEKLSREMRKNIYLQTWNRLEITRLESSRVESSQVESHAWWSKSEKEEKKLKSYKWT